MPARAFMNEREKKVVRLLHAIADVLEQHEAQSPEETRERIGTRDVLQAVTALLMGPDETGLEDHIAPNDRFVVLGTDGAAVRSDDRPSRAPHPLGKASPRGHIREFLDGFRMARSLPNTGLVPAGEPLNEEAMLGAQGGVPDQLPSLRNDLSVLADRIEPEETRSGVVEVAIAVRGSAVQKEWKAASHNGKHLLKWLAAVRQQERTGVRSMVRKLGGNVLTEHTVGNIIVARVPLDSLDALAETDGVLSVVRNRQPQAMPGESQPTAEEVAELCINQSTGAVYDWEPYAFISDARDAIGCDQYYAKYGKQGIFGLIDSGVRRTHALLYAGKSIGRGEGDYVWHPDNRIRLWRDCEVGSQPASPESLELGVCSYDGSPASGDFGEDSGGAYPCGDGHGTKTACILAGRGVWGDEYRGVTAAKIDSWRQTHSSISEICTCLEGAIVNGASVIVAEVDFDGEENHPGSPMARAFDDACFIFGIPVIAAVGNSGWLYASCNQEGAQIQFGSVGCPGNSHGALAIGYYDPLQPSAMTCASSIYDSDDRYRQSRGPTVDGRVKPDVLAPTRTVSGGRESDEAITLYCHSSGSTPYGAGACLLLKNFFNSNGLGTEPGKLYAALIAFGDLPYLSSTETEYKLLNTDGAGRFRLGTLENSAWMTGMRYVSVGSTANHLVFPVPGTGSNLRVAIWWPESPGTEDSPEIHARISLEIRRYADGVLIGRSDDISSVFQKVWLEGALAPDAGGEPVNYLLMSMVPLNFGDDGWFKQTVYYFVYYEW